MQKNLNNVRPFVWWRVGGIKRVVGAKLAAFLQLAFIMVSAQSGDWYGAKGDRWNCFHNLFKYVVNFSSPFKPSPAALTVTQ